MHRAQGHLTRIIAAAAAVALGTGCIGKVLEGGGDGGDDDDNRPPPVIEPGVRCDDERPGPQQLRLLTRREYANTMKDLLGVDVSTDTVPVEPKVKGFDNNAAAMVITSRHMDAFLALGEDAAEKAITTQRSKILACDPGNASCPSQFVRDLGLKAFRRPLSDEETAAFAGAFSGNSFDDGMRISIAAMLVSPSFLYRSEIGEVKNGVATLTPYETASALSYLYWGTMPDKALFDAAAAGKLSTTEEIQAQARRLLASERSRAQVTDFVAQWLRTEEAAAGNKDATIYPAFTPEIREAIVEEQRRFIEDIVFTKNGTFEDLFLADYVIVNDALARFYGLQGPGNGGFGKVTTDTETGRGGLLGLGTVLAAHAHSNESSPVKRGVFVRSRLLCQELAPPPPDVDATPPGLDPTLTTRERFARHTSDPSCSGCHQYIDGVGFAFEGFDGIGALRAEENGIPVDVSGELVGLEDLDTSSKMPFSGVRELAEIIANSQAGQACLPLQYFRFARGVEETTDDSCAVHNLQLAFGDADKNIQELLVGITALPTFTKRDAN
jgi:hypothetical protein